MPIDVSVFARRCCETSAPGAADPAPLPMPPANTGSRRRRLWELGAVAHCPVIGSCIPIDVLRRLVSKVVGAPVEGDDYELHAGVISECEQRGAIAEAAQRELDRRAARALRRSAAARSADALWQWWRAELAGDDIPGALWAALTHPRCDAVVEERVLHDIHMLQHQLGSAARADVQRLHALEAANAALTRELASAQGRAAQLAAEQARKIEQLQADGVRTRAELIGRDTVIASLWERLGALEDAAPALKTRIDLTRENQRQAERLLMQGRALLHAREQLEAERRRADSREAAWQRLAARTEAPPAAPPLPAPSLAERAVLCVGGRSASVPVYRRVIERVGGRFLHHDGGEHDNPAVLETTLASADLVICQTGCISHDAYWRVKDHCKRHGKRCVFVDNPSRSSLQRALVALAPAERAAQAADEETP